MVVARGGLVLGLASHGGSFYCLALYTLYQLVVYHSENVFRNGCKIKLGGFFSF